MDNVIDFSLENIIAAKGKALIEGKIDEKEYLDFIRKMASDLQKSYLEDSSENSDINVTHQGSEQITLITEYSGIEEY